jgi:hypothetical protein
MRSRNKNADLDLILHFSDDGSNECFYVFLIDAFHSNKCSLVSVFIRYTCIVVFKAFQAWFERIWSGTAQW